MLANALFALLAMVMCYAGYGPISEVIHSVKRGYFRFCIDRRIYRHQRPCAFWAYCVIAMSMGVFIVSFGVLFFGLCVLGLLFP